MAKGAKQKSNVILLASGSKHARKAEPKMQTAIGPPPPHFDDVALAAWNTIVDDLKTAGTIFQVDRFGLETLCMALQRLRNAQKIIAEYGEVTESPDGKLEKNPACTIETAANATIKSYICEFGLTPATRGKVTAPTPTEINPFENL
jgi:P27 family predicted phage terminase small subunit